MKDDVLEISLFLTRSPPGAIEQRNELECRKAGLLSGQLANRVPENGMAGIEQRLCKIVVLIHEGVVRTLQEVLVLFAVPGEVSAVPMEDGTSLLPVVGGAEFLCRSGVSHADGTLKLRRSFQRL